MVSKLIMMGAILGRVVFACPRRRPYLELLKWVGGGRRDPRQRTEPPYFVEVEWGNISYAVDFPCPRASLSRRRVGVWGSLPG